MATIEDRAFLDKRVTVDGEMLVAYASLRGCTPLEAGRMFGARLAVERDTCKLKWRQKTLGWQCSACGRVTRTLDGSAFTYCPQCGAVVVE